MILGRVSASRHPTVSHLHRLESIPLQHNPESGDRQNECQIIVIYIDTINSITFNPDDTQLSSLCCRSEFQELQLLFSVSVCTLRPGNFGTNPTHLQSDRLRGIRPTPFYALLGFLPWPPHRARMADSLLQRLVFFKCNMKLPCSVTNLQGGPKKVSHCQNH